MGQERRYSSLRVSSIKTRIKTFWFLTQQHKACCALRVSSIKTRIKTETVLGCFYCYSLWEYLPLKQGLRLNVWWWYRSERWLWEYLPLKQGLRQKERPFFKDLPVQLWEYLPLKQGLRLKVRLFKPSFSSLWEYLPLKQGLRLDFWIFDPNFFLFRSESIFH